MPSADWGISLTHVYLAEDIAKPVLKIKDGIVRMPSGAGHDAVYVARVAPAAMIFVPCKDGISHNEIEDATPADLAAGCSVLLHAMLARAGTVG